MRAITLNKTDSDRRKRIEREILGPRSLLRRGSVPKWCNPKPRSPSPSPSSDSELEEEACGPRPSKDNSDRAPLPRKDSTKSLNNLERPRTPLEDRTELRWVRNPVRDETRRFGHPAPTGLCEVCRGINFEAMAGENGFDHLLIRDINESRWICRMCDFLRRQFSGKISGYTEDRYRIRLCLDDNRDRWSDDHYKPDSSMTEFSTAMVRLMDLRPWEPPEDYKVRHRYDSSENPKSYLKPQGSGPESVRGRSVSCLTEEHDPARQIGLRWIRNIGNNTSSMESIEIAKGWLEKCQSAGDEISGGRVLPLRQGITLTARLSQIRAGFYSSSDSDEPSEPDISSEPDTSSEIEASPESEASSESGASSDFNKKFKPLQEAFPQDYPARLVRINESSSKEIILCLINAQDCSFQYAALSYCWGFQSLDEGRKWQLTEANERPHRENIQVDKLPQTICDSITLAWKLGISYIWIDALCIVQDSASDWAQEAAKMAGIYRGSVVTIAVSASVSAQQGGFNSTSQRTTELDGFEDLITVKGKLANGQESSLYFLDLNATVPELYEEEILNAPLAKRAWTYQEHVLPQRVLYLTSKQLLWECMHCRLSEDNFPQTQAARPYPILDFDYVLGPDKIAAFWYVGAIQQYSQRQMTFKKDKLVAISALAKATYHNRQSDYIAGLWKDTLILGLMWCRSSDGHKSKTFSCPSWSWASQDSAVSYHHAADALGEEMDRRFMSGRDNKEPGWYAWPACRMINIDWKPDENNKFGSVSDAYIDLHTVLGSGIVILRGFDNIRFSEDKIAQAILLPYTTKSGKEEWMEAVATMDDSGVTGARVAIALLREPTNRNPTFLLLDPPDLNAGTFRRVGLAELDRYAYRSSESDGWLQVVKSWERKTIRLI